MRMSRRGYSGVDLAILAEIQDAPCNGLTRLAEAVGASRRRYVRARAERLQREGLLTLAYPRQFPGRGHCIVIRKARRK